MGEGIAIYLLFIKRLKERFFRDEDGVHPSSWTELTQVVSFTSEDAAYKYIAALKSEYNGKGRVKAGTISGKKIYHDNNLKLKETITTCLKCVDDGRLINVVEETRKGEYPYSDDGLLSCDLDFDILVH